jgi:tRNA(Ile2) C34 agmatinyltransferase TiaS
MKDDSFARKKWVTPCRNIIAVYDGSGYVEIIEQPDCFGEACWSEHHYKLASDLIVSARNVGSSMRYMTKVGSTDLQLVPSIAAGGIESVVIDNENILITYAGLGGGGVGATMCRALAEDVIDYDISEA